VQVTDLPVDLAPPLAARLLRAFDTEGKITRALDALGPVADRDVALVGGGDVRTGQLAALGARVASTGWQGARLPLPDCSVDVVIGGWSTFRGANEAEIAEADRVLRAGGRLLVVHDYGRDDVSTLRGPLPEYGAWTRRDGPFLAGGFRIRVLHCWWTFDDIEEARAFIAEAFGEPGVALAAALKRPRLSYNVAVYHRTVEAPS
jgi:SAM-dependent methyltransferase